MKASLFIILTICLMQALSVELPPTLIDEKIQQCFAENNVDLQKVTTILDEGLHIVNEEPLVITLANCVVERKEFMKNGEFNKEPIIAIEKVMVSALKKDLEDPGKATEIAFDKCKNQKGEQHGARFIHLHNCIMNEA